MRSRLVLVLVLTLMTTLTGTALGHHGWSGYDAAKEMTLSGTIRWVTPDTSSPSA